ncbi:L-2-hydroxyglutarate oxidase [Microlunatus aurantiacus]|uniref:L-2-hydroxyglutarate oxidase n=1 Tax=Microlunatus aurantiacus TaxID=446786 RepID=A0ABP7DPC7_9ACTN
MAEIVVAGAGIVGLATARELTTRGHRVTVLEKEPEIARHQTGRNSGVIHSGLYYAPGSLKATLGTAGAASMRDFAREHGIPVDICGKLVVATRPEQLAALSRLHDRGRANGVPVCRVDPDEARELEPYVSCVAGLRVESTGIVDYSRVCRTLDSLITAGGGQVLTGEEIVAVDTRGDGVIVTTRSGEHRAERFVNCAGLQSDRLARLAGLEPDVRIVPFRGEYFELKPAYEHLVTGLIYPVPDPTLPFLGVHLTTMINGGVHAGPNAVLALAREGYSWTTVKPADVADYLRWPGSWRLGRRYWKTGLGEIRRSLSPARFLASLRELVPALPDDSLVPAPAGVRAQALRRDGTMVDDFAYVRAPRQIHVLNAPSPAATASLEIGRVIADEVDRL